MSGIFYNNKFYPCLSGEQKLLLDGAEAKDGQVITYVNNKNKIIDVNLSEDIFNKYTGDQLDVKSYLYIKIVDGRTDNSLVISEGEADDGMSVRLLVGKGGVNVYLTPDIVNNLGNSIDIPLEENMWLDQYNRLMPGGDAVLRTTEDYFNTYPIDLESAIDISEFPDNIPDEGTYVYANLQALDEIFVNKKGVIWGDTEKIENTSKLYTFDFPIWTEPDIYTKLDLNDVTIDSSYEVITLNVPMSIFNLPDQPYKVDIVMPSSRAELEVIAATNSNQKRALDLLKEAHNCILLTHISESVLSIIILPQYYDILLSIVSDLDANIMEDALFDICRFVLMFTPAESNGLNYIDKVPVFDSIDKAKLNETYSKIDGLFRLEGTTLYITTE